MRSNGLQNWTVVLSAFKLVKWIESIEFVEDYKHLGAGQGG